MVGLALDDDEWAGTVLSVLSSSPDHEVGAGVRGSLAGEVLLFRDLIECVAVLVDEDGKEGLSDEFFGGFDEPFVADGRVDPAPVASKFERGRREMKALRVSSPLPWWCGLSSRSSSWVFSWPSFTVRTCRVLGT